MRRAQGPARRKILLNPGPTSLGNRRIFSWLRRDNDRLSLRAALGLQSNVVVGVLGLRILEICGRGAWKRVGVGAALTVEQLHGWLSAVLRQSNSRQVRVCGRGRRVELVHMA